MLQTVRRLWEVGEPVEGCFVVNTWMVGKAVRKGVSDRREFESKGVLSFTYTLHEELFSWFLVICDDDLHNPLESLKGSPEIAN